MDITTAPDEVTISRKKLYCFARMYQSLENTGSAFMRCAYCKISNGGNQCQYHIADIKRWLRTQTGVNLSVISNARKCQANKFNCDIKLSLPIAIICQ